MQQNKENLIVQMTFNFSLSIIEYCEQLNRMKKFQLSNQLFRCATSIGANVREAQNAESLGDFIHKMKIAAKECDESEYWLSLTNATSNYPDSGQILNEAESIQKILSKIISTSKKKRLLSAMAIFSISILLVSLAFSGN